MLAVGAVTVTVTELALELVPSLTVTEKTRLRSASPIAMAGAVNVGLAADVSLKGHSGSRGLSPGVGQCLAIGVR